MSVIQTDQLAIYLVIPTTMHQMFFGYVDPNDNVENFIPTLQAQYPDHLIVIRRETEAYDEVQGMSSVSASAAGKLEA
jgi:hypothetical protein